MKFLFGDPLKVDKSPATRAIKNLATPAAIGSGPSEMRCKHCQHFRRERHHDYTYFKCGLMEKYWTHGEGTDIRANWPSCSEFQPAEQAVQ